RQATQKKQRTPAEAREEKEVAHRSQQVARSVALLQKAAEQAAQPGRDLFHRERRAYSPLASHAHTEERAQDQKDGETGRESREHFNDGIEDQVQHKRQAPSVAIRKQAE